MSLFSANTWWETKVSSKEEFDSAHLCVGRFCGDSKSNRIGVGSFEGLFRIYAPVKGEYKPQHLVYENDFRVPILACDLIQLDSNEETLVILFNKGFGLYSFFQTEEGLKYKTLAKVDVQRPMYNMLNFKLNGESIICLQSEDGLLSFYTLNNLNCSLQLKNFIIPGPMIYIPQNRCIIIQNSSYQLEAYNYDDIFAKGSQAMADGMQPSWECLVGESVMAFELGTGPADSDQEYGATKNYLLAACENHLFVLLAISGIIKYIKKLQVVPSTITVNNLLGASGGFNFIISSFSHHLLFYKDFQLVWAAKTEHIPHSLKIAKFNDTNGMIVALNDEGFISVMYLGTVPPIINYQIAATRIQTYEELSKISTELREKINEKKELEGNQELGPSDEDSMTVKIDLFKDNSPEANHSDDFFMTESGLPISSKLKISLGYSGIRADKLNIVVKAPEAFLLEKYCFNFDTLKGGSTPCVIESKIKIRNNIPVTNPQIEVSGSYEFQIQGRKYSGCFYKSAIIPMHHYSYMTEIIKDAPFKLTVEGNYPCPSIQDLFSDLIRETNADPNHYSNANAASFTFSHASNATIIIAKNNPKMRIQSDSFDSIYLLLNEIDRLLKIDNSSYSLIYTSDLPLKDFSDTLEARLAITKELIQHEEELEAKTNEIMQIQKRLLTRYKEKNPTGLNNLDVLFEMVHEELIEQTRKVEEYQGYFTANSQKVSSSLKLILLLLRMKCPISEDGFKLLSTYVDTEVNSRTAEIDWIDITQANITHFIQTVLLGKQPPPQSDYPKVESLESFNMRFIKLIDNVASGILADFNFASKGENN